MKSLPPPAGWQAWFQDALALPGDLETALRNAAGSPELPRNVAELGRVVAPSATLTSPERLGIYRDMYWQRLVEALQEDYPSLRALLGDAGFLALARRYVGECPSRTFTLNLYGAGFPDWLAGLPRDEALPHRSLLEDLARLEWARIEVFHAPAVGALRPEELEAVPPDAWPGARLRLVPAHRLLAFRHPLAHWYQRFRETGEAPPPPEPAPSRALVVRAGTAVRILDLTPAAGRLLEALAAGRPLEEALAAAASVSEEEAAGRLGDWFQEWSASGLFAAVDL